MKLSPFEEFFTLQKKIFYFTTILPSQLTLSICQESSSTDDGFVLRSKKQKEKMRGKRRRKELKVIERLRDRVVVKVVVVSEEEKRAALLKDLLEAEPELNTLSDEVICPVCLDLLHEPFQVPDIDRDQAETRQQSVVACLQVEPCGHIFCEPCLRRLGQKNPMSCSCPLCRYWTVHPGSQH